MSKGNSFGSMDWPPIGLSLFSGDGDARNHQVPEARKHLSHNSSMVIADRVFIGSVISDVDRESPSYAPLWMPGSPPPLALTTEELRVEVSLRLDREEAHSLQQDRSIASSALTGASLHLPSSPRIYDLTSPIFPHNGRRAAPVRLSPFNPAGVPSNRTSSEHYRRLC